MNINALLRNQPTHTPLEFACGDHSEKSFGRKIKHSNTKINYDKVIQKLIAVAKILCPGNDDNNLQLTGGASLALQCEKRIRPIYDFDFTANDLDKVKAAITKFIDQNTLHDLDLADERIVKGVISFGKNGKGPHIQFSVTQRKQEVLNLNDNSDLIDSQEILNKFHVDHKLNLQDALDCKESNVQEFSEDAYPADISDFESHLNSEDTSELDDDLKYNLDEDFCGNPNTSCEDVKVLGTDKLTIINALTTAKVKSGLMRRKNKYEHDLADFKIAMNLLKEQGKISKADYEALCIRNNLRNHLKHQLNQIRDPALRKEAKNLLCTSQASKIVHATDTSIATIDIKVEPEQG